MDTITRDLFLNDLMSIISIESVTGNKKAISRCFDEVEKIAKRLEFKSRRCARGRVLEVFPKDGTNNPKIGIITHVDTVPFNEDDWQYRPLGEITDGRVYGRGSIDDKLGVILSLYALKELSGKISPSWKLIIGSCEEGKWVDIESYIAEGNQIPEFLFTIDGDGIQNGCRGTLDIELTFKRKHPSERAVTLFETPQGVINTVPGIVVTNVDGNVKVFMGKEAHSSRPELGVNAISKAFFEYRKILKKEFPGFARFMDDYQLSKVEDEIFKEETSLITDQKMPKTIVTPTMTKLEGDRLLVYLNIRLSPEIETKAQVYSSFFELSKKYECSIKVLELIMPAFIPRDYREITLMCDAYEKVIGRRPIPQVALGTGYNAAFQNAAIFGPRFEEADEKDQDLCHCKDESRRIEDIEKFYDVLVEYLGNSLMT